MPTSKQLKDVVRTYTVPTKNITVRDNITKKDIANERRSDIVGVTYSGQKVCVGFISSSVDYQEGSIFEQKAFNNGDSKDARGFVQVKNLRGKITESYTKRGGVQNWSEHECKPSSLR